MKVLYVHDRPSGGAGESLAQMIACMGQRKTALVLFGGYGPLGNSFKTQTLEIAPFYKKSHSWLARKWEKNFLWSFLWRLIALPSHLPFLFEVIRLARKYRVDLIHTNTISLMEGALAAKILGLTHIWCVRELVDVEFYRYTIPKRFVAWFVSLLSDVVLCNSRRTESGLRSLGANPDKLVTVHNVVSPPGTKRDLHTLLNLPEKIRLVGILGWIRSIKRVEDFVDLASRLADLGDSVRFVIIGERVPDTQVRDLTDAGEVAYGLMIDSMIARSTNAQNIIMTGHLQNAPDYLRSLSVLVCPCGIESFGRSVAEALAAGVPSIGTKNTGVAEIIDHGETGYLVPEGDVDGMESFLRDLLANDEKRRKFGLLGTERVEERFGYKRIHAQIEEVYDRCVNRAAGKPSSPRKRGRHSPDKMMKVLYVHDRPSGGAGESLYRIVRGRQKHGESIVVFGATGFVKHRFDDLHLDPPPIYQRAYLWVDRRWQNKQWPSLLWRILVLPFHLPFLLRILHTARQHNVDIVHTNCVYLVEGAIAAKILGLPHVWHVRELVDLDYYQYVLPKQHVTRFWNLLSDIVICPSQRAARALTSYGVDSAKLRVIPNIVDLPETDLDLRKKLDLSTDVLLVGIVGWITPNKRIEDFVALASRVEDCGDQVRFLIIGGHGGVKEYDDLINHAIASSANRENILRIDTLRDANCYMGSLDVLVCPCFSESFGRTVAEALSAGTPAIGVGSTAVAEIIDDGETGFLVEDGDVDRMAECVRILLCDDEIRRQFGELGKRRMAERFATTRIIPRIEGVYKEADTR